VQQMVMRDIDDIVRAMGKDIHTYGLPELDDHEDEEGYHKRRLGSNTLLVSMKKI
jgi:hypothetical protein